MGTVLIGYATRTSAAADVADAIATVMREGGHVVRVANLDQEPRVDGADLVVVGSGINATVYYPEATAWLKANADELAATDVAVFNTCLNAADPEKRDAALAYNDAAVARHDALASATFAGRYVPAKVSWFSKLFGKVTGQKARDHVDTEAARAWAQELLALVATPEPARPPL